MDAQFLNPNIIKCMNPVDRKALHVETPEESKSKADAKAERRLQAECESYLRLNGIEFLHMSFRSREKIGWPDICYASPYHNGQFCAVELKSATGSLSYEQGKVLQRIQANGARVAVIRSTEKFIEFVGAKV